MFSSFFSFYFYIIHSFLRPQRKLFSTFKIEINIGVIGPFTRVRELYSPNHFPCKILLACFSISASSYFLSFILLLHFHFHLFLLILIGWDMFLLVGLVWLCPKSNHTILLSYLNLHLW